MKKKNCAIISAMNMKRYVRIYFFENDLNYNGDSGLASCFETMLVVEMYNLNDDICVFAYTTNLRRKKEGKKAY